MSTKDPSTATGQHLRAMREARRTLIKEGRPEHLCARCGSVTFEVEEACLHCGQARPEKGWMALKDSHDSWLGRLIDDRYLVTRPLGQGASAEVYCAESLSISRQFAVKIIATDKGQQAEQIIARLNREIEALSRLRNPHIVSFYEILDLKGKFVAAVMDLIDGDTLEDLILNGGPLSIGRACALLRQTANGLYEAHQAGMIHRDLKPENLMVERLPAGDDFVHILDFGIVRLTDDASVSMTHGFIGTPLYASPEQAMAKKIDHRSDIYSLGAILFFMLTGKPPFVSNNVYDVLRMHVRKQPPRLSDVRPQELFPEYLERLVAAMLAKDPSQRPDDLSEVIAELDKVQDTQMLEARSQVRQTQVSDSHEALDDGPDTGSHGFDREEHTSAATLHAFGPRKPAATPSSPRQTPHGNDQIDAIPAEIHFQGSQSESSAATAIPSAAYALSTSSTQARAAFGPAGRFLLLEAQDPPEVQIFQPEATSPTPLPIPTQATVQAVALAEDHVIAGHSDGSISRVTLTKGQSKTLFQDVRRRPITAVAVSGNGDCVVAGSKSGRVYMHHQQRTSSSDWARIRSGAEVNALALGQNAESLAVARADNGIEVVSLFNPRTPTAQFRSHAPVRSMAISPDGYLLAAALVDRSVHLYQLPTGQKILSLHADDVDILAVFFSERARPVAVCAVRRKIRLLEFEELGAMTHSR